MDFDTSFDEYTDGKKFIALVVSDNEDDYNSSVDSVDEEEVEEEHIEAHKVSGTDRVCVSAPATQGGKTSAALRKPIGGNPALLNSGASPKVSTVNASVSVSSLVKPKSEEKKRWSFMSNHSSSSSSNNAKKRWSTLSTFTIDSGNNSKEAKESKENRDSKFLKRVSTHSSLSSHRRTSVISTGTVATSGTNSVNDSTDHITRSPSRSLKRSSTGSSLRQLFGLIAISDDSKENAKNLHKISDKDNFKVPSKVLTGHSYYSKPMMQTERRNSNFRAPLAPIVNETSRQRHSVMIGNNNYSDYHSDYNKLNNGDGQRFHTHSPSISSLSSMVSQGSKWKFWKKGGGNSLSRSSSNQSLNANAKNPHSSNMVNSGFGESKMRPKSSFSDFHKSIFSHSNSSGNAIDSGNDAASVISGSVSKRLSTSNMSINGLKHMTSQSSLKHKTSHSSLQRFKTRRRSSNTCGPDDSSVSSHNTSTSQGPQISLPVPDQTSRDKIRAKLKNSTSLLSLSSSTPVIMKDYDESLLQQILEYSDVKHIIDDYKKLPSLKNATQLTTHVWRSKNGPDPVIYKKLPLGTLEDVTYSKQMCLQELKMLRLCNGTTGLPILLKSYVVRESSPDEFYKDGKLFLFLVLKDHGTPLSGVNLNSWFQILRIFWQCVTVLYVAETKFQFEHRNLTLDHILIDKKLNVTLCDLKSSRAQQGPNESVLFTRLDHPLFFQGGGDYQFEIYSFMRSILAESHSWDSYEPKTNLLWLHYFCVKMFRKYDNKLSGTEREKMSKLAQFLDPSITSKRGVFKRNDADIRTCGDLLRFK